MKENLNEEIKRNRELMGLMTEGESSENSSLFNKQKEDLNIIDLSPLSKYPRQNEKLENTSFFITHHTGGYGNCQKVINVLNNRKNDKTKKPEPLGIHYIVDREGNVCRGLPQNSRGAHILPSSSIGATNDNSQGVEIIATGDNDVLAGQALSVLKLIKKLDISPSQIYGHGEVNPGHRSASEGQRMKKFIFANYDKDPFKPYDYSMFTSVVTSLTPKQQKKVEDQELQDKIKDVGKYSMTNK